MKKQNPKRLPSQSEIMSIIREEDRFWDELERKETERDLKDIGLIKDDEDEQERD